MQRSSDSVSAAPAIGRCRDIVSASRYTVGQNVVADSDAGDSVTSRKVVSECTILITCQLAACSSTSSAEVTSRLGEGSSVTIVM